MSQGNVFFQNKLAGKIEKRTDGSFSFKYEQGASEDISLTLPRTPSNYHSEDLFPFFDGLIPEGWLLNLAQKNWKIPSNDRMSLLLAACQDCIGAVHVLNQVHSDEQTSFVTPLEKQGRPEKTTGQCLLCLQELDAKEHLYHIKCAKNFYEFEQIPQLTFSNDDLEQLALAQLNRHLTLTGVQRKLSLATSSDKQQRLTVNAQQGRFILKPPTSEYEGMPAIEHLCMKLAEAYGLSMAQSALITMSDGQLAYITKRFDRLGQEKVPMEDFCQLSGKLTAKKYQSSSEAMGKVIDQYSHQPQDDKLTLFQMLLFSFWIGNADMHLKNFSLWRDPRNQLIRMSPGYDFLSTRLLISVKDDPEEMALPINGRKNKIQWKDFLLLAENFKLPPKPIERLRETLLDGFFDSMDLIDKSFLNDRHKEEFLDLLRERSERLAKN